MLVPVIIGALFALFAHLFLPAVLQGAIHSLNLPTPAPTRLLIEYGYLYYLLPIMAVAAWTWAYRSATEKNLRRAFGLLVATLSLQLLMSIFLMIFAIGPFMLL
jgi:hypothetical protein